jgi:hypothetical protein
MQHTFATTVDFDTQPHPQSRSSFITTYANYATPMPIPFSTLSLPLPSITSNSDDPVITTLATKETTANTVAAVLPSNSYLSFVLGDGNPDSSCSMSEVCDFGPISEPHLVWRATVWNSSYVQIPVDTLLKNGAHLALVRPDFASDLNLPICKLTKPMRITLALQNSPTVVELSDYVILSLSSLNNAWSS